MISDLLQMGIGQTVNTEVCVVGSGAAGLAFAREFLETRTQLLVLESGGLNREEAADALSEGENSGIPNAGPSEGRCRVFGGTTDVWPGGCIPLTDIDFDERPWVPFSGWPIGRADLDGYYARAATMLRVPNGAFEDDIWSLLRVQGPTFDEGLLSHCHTLFSPRPHRFLGKVLRRKFEGSSNVRVLLHTTATEFRTNASGTSVEHLEAKAPGGAQITVRAKAFVICGGGFENPRLLLMSNGIEPGGVGNHHDQVGRYFQDHPHASIGTIETELPASLQKPYGASFSGFPPRPRPYPKIRLSPELQRERQVLNCVANVVWDVDEGSGEQGMLALFRALRALRTPILPRAEIAKILRDLPGTARFVARYVKGRASITPPKTTWLLGGAEQAPNPDSRVTLSENRDPLGSPMVKLDWRLTELDRRTSELMACTVRDEFERLDLGHLNVPDWLRDGAADWSSHMFGPFHPTGTTRMASDPKRGVVDENCQVHGIPNLFIGGSSVFPTSGYANPTFTIVALAIRLADHVKAVLR